MKQELYVTSTKRQKMAISRSIVEAVRSLDPPGRFLEKDPETGLWSDIGDKKAIEKVSSFFPLIASALSESGYQDCNTNTYPHKSRSFALCSDFSGPSRWRGSFTKATFC